MVKPDLASSERTPCGEMLFGSDEPSIGTPARLIEQTEILFAHLPFVRTICIHDPDIVAAAAIGGKGNPFAIG